MTCLAYLVDTEEEKEMFQIYLENLDLKLKMI